MTYQQLKNLRFLKNEIRYLKRKIDECEKNVGALCSPSFTEVHSAAANISQPEREAESIDELRALYAERLKTYNEELIKAERFIAEISDSYTRLIFSLRFIDGCSWQKIATTVGGNNTADNMRKVVFRYVKKHL